MNNSKVSISKKFSMATLWLKDSIGITVGSMPLRLGELWLVCRSFFSVVQKPRQKISRNDLFLLLFLLMNFLYVFSQFLILSDQIETSYCIKYLLRNLIYLCVFTCLLPGREKYSDHDINYLFILFIKIELIFLVIFSLSGYRLYLGSFINTHREATHKLSLFGITITRFMGTASEPGYLAPLIVGPMYYFSCCYIKKREYGKYLTITFIISVLTFSSAVYVATISAFCVPLIKYSHKKVNKNIFIILLVLSLLSFFALGNEKISAFMNGNFFEKFASFVGVSNTRNFSGSDRNIQISTCWKMYKDSGIVEKIIGHGTGAYAHSVKYLSGMLSEAEEAYNIYLSTLYDRGMFGLLFIGGIFAVLKGYVVKDNDISSALYIGIVAQIIHWGIVGNFWLNSFWLNAIFLIGYYNYKKYGEERGL